MTLPPTLDLRDLGSDDVAAMLQLEQACYAAPWSRWMLASEVTRDPGVAFGVWDAHGKLAGMLLAARLADAWHILNLAVHPDLRRAGIASTLLDELIVRTREDGNVGYTLEVRPSNDAALALYRRHGFVDSGLRPRYYVDGEDALVMWRPPQVELDAIARGEEPTWQPPT